MKVLIINRDAMPAQKIYQYLVHENFRCEIASNVEEGKHMIENSKFECILLDISISKDKGLNLLKYLRKNRKKEGIIVLSSKKSIEEAIYSLKLGADDYMSEPLNLEELSARIGSIIRRKYPNDDMEIRFKNLVMDTLSRKVTIEKNRINLTKTEYEILFLLLINRDRVISKEELVERLTGQTDIYFYNFDILYAHIKNLKRKLLSLGQCIKTIYATGYCISE